MRPDPAHIALAMAVLATLWSSTAPAIGEPVWPAVPFALGAAVLARAEFSPSRRLIILGLAVLSLVVVLVRLLTLWLPVWLLGR